ncbi:hypothetical protein GCM10009533_04100 [Saccharopolyspora spinosporotrichia]|uniref:Uncharacterized protein n=1 Tax=Saccharopolyspora erythraea TaxID=1836 RepID=A0ABN1BZ32_SACER
MHNGIGTPHRSRNRVLIEQVPVVQLHLPEVRRRRPPHQRPHLMPGTQQLPNHRPPDVPRGSRDNNTHTPMQAGLRVGGRA